MRCVRLASKMLIRPLRYPLHLCKAPGRLRYCASRGKVSIPLTFALEIHPLARDSRVRLDRRKVFLRLLHRQDVLSNGIGPLSTSVFHPRPPRLCSAATGVTVSRMQLMHRRAAAPSRYSLTLGKIFPSPYHLRDACVPRCSSGAGCLDATAAHNLSFVQGPPGPAGPGPKGRTANAGGG